MPLLVNLIGTNHDLLAVNDIPKLVHTKLSACIAYLLDAPAPALNVARAVEDMGNVRVEGFGGMLANRGSSAPHRIRSGRRVLSGADAIPAPPQPKSAGPT